MYIICLKDRTEFFEHERCQTSYTRKFTVNGIFGLICTWKMVEEADRLLCMSMKDMQYFLRDK